MLREVVAHLSLCNFQQEHNPVQILSNNVLTQPTVSEIHPLNGMLQMHLSPVYWAWKALYEASSTNAWIGHPDVLIHQAKEVEQREGRSGWLVSCTSGNQLEGAAPLIPKRISTRLAGAVGYAPLLSGWRLGGDQPLVADRSDCLPLLCRSLLECVAREPGSFLLVEDLEEHSELHRQLQAAAGGKFLESSPTGFQARYRMEISPDVDAFWGRFSPQTRYSLTRGLKKAKNLRVQKYSRLEDVPAFLELSHQISLQTWQSHQLGLRIKNSAEEVEFYTLLATLGILRSYVLFLEDQPVAFIMGTQCNGIFSLEELGYDQNFRQAGPGKMLLLKAIEEMTSHDPPRIFDFGLGDADYKRTLATSETCSGSVWFLKKTLKNRLLLTNLKRSQQLKTRVKAVLAHLGVHHRVRNWLRTRAQRKQDAPAS